MQGTFGSCVVCAQVPLYGSIIHAMLDAMRTNQGIVKIATRVANKELRTALHCHNICHNLDTGLPVLDPGTVSTVTPSTSYAHDGVSVTHLFSLVALSFSCLIKLLSC